MKKEENKKVPEKNENNLKDSNTGKPKKKVTASSISDIIQPATGNARANASGSHLDDGTWVDYEEDK